MGKQQVCRLVAKGQYVGFVSISLYVGIVAMLTSETSVLISLLIVAPISMVLVRTPAIVSMLTYLSTVNIPHRLLGSRQHSARICIPSTSWWLCTFA
jgi:hypothetical protein